MSEWITGCFAEFNSELAVSFVSICLLWGCAAQFCLAGLGDRLAYSIKRDLPAIALGVLMMGISYGFGTLFAHFLRDNDERKVRSVL